MKKDKYSKRYTITLPDGGKITADAGTLNMLGCVLFEASEHYNIQGCDALARRAIDTHKCIHDYLEERHFYDD